MKGAYPPLSLSPLDSGTSSHLCNSHSQTCNRLHYASTRVVINREKVEWRHTGGMLEMLGHVSGGGKKMTERARPSLTLGHRSAGALIQAKTGRQQSLLW